MNTTSATASVTAETTNGADTVWDIVNAIAGQIDGITDWNQDRTDPTVTQVRIDLADGSIIYLADDHDPATGEVNGWTAAVYADETELDHQSCGSQDGSDSLTDLATSLRQWGAGAA